MSDGLPATLHLKVVTPRRLLAETEVEAVFLPTLEGQIGVLPGHRPLFVGIGKGKLRLPGGRRRGIVRDPGRLRPDPARKGRGHDRGRRG